MKREELKAILQNAYTQEKWIKTLQFLSGSKNLLTISLEPKSIEIKSAKAKEIVSEIVQLGSLKTTDGINLPIFDVTLLDGIKIEHNRVSVNDLLKNHILKDAIKGAIVTFHYSKKYNKNEWRFSFISKFGSDYFAETESIETNPKKFTYIFGTSEEHRTALERLYDLQQSKFELKDFFDAFNVEPISKDFFNNYIKFYKDFVNYLSGEELIKGKWVSINEPSIYFDDVFNNNSIEVRNFVKRLLGRIVFLYFIQKKGWLGAKSDKYDDGNPNFLQNLFVYDNTTRDNFYNSWLSKLFFDALNNKKRKNDEFLMPNKELLFVPFLNGGLFDEVQEPKNHRKIEFPPILFELLFNFFNGYNFTIYENSPEDHTIAVDPEMLGNIFENLLEDNKDKGAFYTPKEIVHYMAQESLIEYLNTNIQVSKELLNNLIKNHTTDGLKKEELLTIEKLVDTVKICDPAIGSGAFPMGLLQEIFSLKALLHFALNKNPEDWKPAEAKQAIIENSIYGVDIEPGAVDIARLRFWLSLVVDEPIPKPLPNLDFKIIVGNSLLSRYKLDSSIEDVFKNLNKNRKNNKLEPITLQSYKDCMNDYMYLSDAESKKEYKILIKEIKDAFVTTYSNDKINGLAKARGKYENLLRVDIFGKPLGTKTEIVKAKKELEAEENKRKEAEDGLHYRDAIEWRFEFPNILDVDGNYQGFDIVIGNPPYIQIKWLNDKSSIENSSFETFSKTGDVY
jgi:adenine-specific DNA-methyltransferase